MMNRVWFGVGDCCSYQYLGWLTESAAGAGKRVSPCAAGLSRNILVSSSALAISTSKQTSTLACHTLYTRQALRGFRYSPPPQRRPSPIPLASLLSRSLGTYTATGVSSPTTGCPPPHFTPPSPALPCPLAIGLYHGTNLQILREWPVSFRPGLSFRPSRPRALLWFRQQHFRKYSSSRCRNLSLAVCLLRVDV